MAQGWTEFARRYRVPLSFFAVTGLLLAAYWRGVRPRAIHDPADLPGLTGALLVLSGVLLRSWAAGVVHKSEILATTGPYALARHPLYAGSILIGGGFGLILADAVTLAGFAAVFGILYLPRIRQEEAKLAGKFGLEWRGYAERTGAFFPKRIPGAPDRSGSRQAGWSLARWLHNKEYNAFGVSLAALAALVWLQHRG